MDAIPRTPNGKTDRLGSPPERNRPDGNVPPKAPGTSNEIELAAIWADVLGIDRIGTDETVVELGGDSLIAATIAARVAAGSRSKFRPAGCSPPAPLATWQRRSPARRRSDRGEPRQAGG